MKFPVQNRKGITYPVQAIPEGIRKCLQNSSELPRTTAGAVQIGENKEPSFTAQFQNYWNTYSASNKDGLLFVHGWRQMLAGFNLSLVEMKDEELSTVARLLEYQHRAATLNIDE